jgi:hypothetical protein
MRRASHSSKQQVWERAIDHERPTDRVGMQTHIYTCTQTVIALTFTTIKGNTERFEETQRVGLGTVNQTKHCADNITVFKYPHFNPILK